MIIAKLTILLTLAVIFLTNRVKAWGKSNPRRVYLEDYPWWVNLTAWLIILDTIGIFASVIWFLFIYL